MTSKLALSIMREFIEQAAHTYPLAINGDIYTAVLKDDKKCIHIFNSSVVKDDIFKTAEKIVNTVIVGDIRKFMYTLVVPDIQQLFVSIYKKQLFESQKTSSAKGGLNKPVSVPFVNNNGAGSTTPGSTIKGKDVLPIEGLPADSLIAMVASTYGVVAIVNGVIEKNKDLIDGIISDPTLISDLKKITL